MDGLLFRGVKRGQLPSEGYSIGHQSIFTTNVATALESKRDVIHTPRDIGGGQTFRMSLSFFFSNTHKFCPST
jgi:hypothetical protein